MDDTPLLNAIASALIFLELSGPEVLDQDAAMAALEEIAADLAQLEPPDRRRVVEYFRSLADTAQTPAERQCYLDAGVTFGLEPE